MIQTKDRRLPVLKNVKLDIGCGEKVTKGFIGMDKRDCGQEIIWDATDGIPFPDNSVDTICTSHFLEHLEDDESVDFLQECMRVLKHKGEMINRLPHASHPTACYVGHKTFWNEWKVEALLRMTEKIEPFIITQNFQDGAELKFILQKI